MAMVGLATYFTLLEREALKDEVPFHSVRDIVEFTGDCIATSLTREDIIARIAERHRRREKQIRETNRRAAAKT